MGGQVGSCRIASSTSTPSPPRHHRHGCVISTFGLSAGGVSSGFACVRYSCPCIRSCAACDRQYPWSGHRRSRCQDPDSSLSISLRFDGTFTSIRRPDIRLSNTSRRQASTFDRAVPRKPVKLRAAALAKPWALLSTNPAGRVYSSRASADQVGPQSKYLVDIKSQRLRHISAVN